MTNIYTFILFRCVFSLYSSLLSNATVMQQRRHGAVPTALPNRRALPSAECIKSRQADTAV